MPVKSLFNLFFPDLCAACGQTLVRGEKTICISCINKLSFTDYHKNEDNPVSRVFYGRCTIEQAMAMCLYERDSTIQHLVHLLKYKSRRDVGLLLGNELAKTLLNSPLYNTIDAIIPVPLHRKKERIRGYNQALVIAEGMSETLGKPIIADALVRVEFTETQTKKKRWDRYENVKNMFGVKNEDKIKEKHLLLIDDVITTGATIEACAKHLLNVENVKVSIAGLASSA
ncbi:MAG: ComF family protein [Bacteroidales bacterium]|nr:ComF family protein [Bacteroidales bacterium]